MTFPTLGSGCSGLKTCIGFRGIIAVCANNDGVNANMIAWVNNYDLTTVPWNILRSVTFSDPSLTEPDNLGADGQPVDAGDASTQCNSICFLIDNTGAPFVNATVQRAQVWWPGGSPFGVIAKDAWNALQTGWLCCCGTTGPCNKIFELPVPNADYAADFSGTPWNRLQVFAALGLTAATVQSEYVNTMAFGIGPNYGPNWNPSQVCQAAGNDPFTGDPDP